KRRSGLAQPQIPQSDVIQHLQLVHQARRGGEKRDGFFHSELQHLVNVDTAVFYVKHRRLKTGSFAIVADHFDIRQELHLYGTRAVALASLAAAARDVEREMARRVAAPVRLGSLREQFANQVEGLDV